MASESAQQVKLNARLETLLAAKCAELQRMKQDAIVANAKIVQLASNCEALKGQVSPVCHHDS
jgi:hypothetical protein